MSWLQLSNDEQWDSVSDKCLTLACNMFIIKHNIQGHVSKRTKYIPTNNLDKLYVY